MIGEGAFSDCTALRSVNIPSTITKWGYGAFHNCSNLAKVQLSEGLQIVWPGAFANCSALRSVTVPSTVIGLDNYAFDRCNNLAEVKLNEGLQLIGEGTFQYCAALRSATVPSTVTELGVRAFRGCSNLSEVIFLVGERLLNKTFLDRRLSGEEGILNRRKINEMNGRHAFYDCPLAAVKISISWALCERMARLLPECSVSVVERIRRLPRLEHIQDGRVFACWSDPSDIFPRDSPPTLSCRATVFFSRAPGGFLGCKLDPGHLVRRERDSRRASREGRPESGEWASPTLQCSDRAIVFLVRPFHPGGVVMIRPSGVVMRCLSSDGTISIVRAAWAVEPPHFLHSSSNVTLSMGPDRGIFYLATFTVERRPAQRHGPRQSLEARRLSSPPPPRRTKSARSVPPRPSRIFLRQRRIPGRRTPYTSPMCA